MRTLLVLDVACFGDEDDGDDVVLEMGLVLSGGSQGSRGSESGTRNNMLIDGHMNVDASGEEYSEMNRITDYLDLVRNTHCTDDHRRAVNTVFAIPPLLP